MDSVLPIKIWKTIAQNINVTVLRINFPPAGPIGHTGANVSSGNCVGCRMIGNLELQPQF
jgi:hypothetical protein